MDGRKAKVSERTTVRFKILTADGISRAIVAGVKNDTEGVFSKLTPAWSESRRMVVSVVVHL